ncbi:hypothetical protein BZA77DRAFT_2525 [Pyronema omphalodes]|nr:hypothetical protein BZA77DRAFT_2525 [Pyronema omphalodes]
MTGIVGPWVAGTFDPDRSSARAAKDALLRIFKTEEKLDQIWEAYQSAILEFCRDTITNESVYSLSDERYTPPDDAKAKFDRVLACCALCVARLITGNSEKMEEQCGELLGEKQLWTGAFAADPYLRRAVYKLLMDALEKMPHWIKQNLGMVSTAMLKGAKNQIASVTTYLSALLALTQKYPETWTSTKLRKSALMQFVEFIEMGSQVAPPTYWNQVFAVISEIPKEVLKKDEGAKKLLEGIVKGIQSGPEPRTHMIAAWGCYWDTCFFALELELGFDEWILQDIAEFYCSYLSAEKPKDRYIISQDEAVAATVCGVGLVKLDTQKLGKDVSKNVLDVAWAKAEQSVIAAIKAEREATENGLAVIKMGESWTRLCVGALKQLSKDGAVYELVVKSNISVLRELIDSLVATNGKCIGAATFLQLLLTKIGTELLHDTASKESTWNFFANKLTDILHAETAEHLLEAFVSYGAHVDDSAALQDAWAKTVHALMMSELPKEKKETCFILLLNSASVHLADKISPISELDSYIVNKMRASLPEEATSNSWVLVKDALNTTHNIVSQESTSKILVELLENMSIDDSSRLVKIMRTISGTNPQRLLPFINSKHGEELISKLLVLANSPEDEVSSSATKLREIITTAVSKNSEEAVGRLTDMTVENIRASVLEPTSEHLSVEYLSAKAASLVKESPKEAISALVEKLLFSKEQWETAAAPFLQKIKHPSLAITNPLGGCIFLAENETIEEASTSYDDEGQSTLLRMAMFSMEFATSIENVTSVIPAGTLITLIHYLLLAKELSKDNLSVNGSTALWKYSNSDVETEMLEFTTSISQWISTLLEGDKEAHVFSPALVDALFEASKGSSIGAFYSARALSSVINTLCSASQHFRNQAVAFIENRSIWKTTDIFLSAAMLDGAADIITVSKREHIWTGLIGTLLGVTPAQAATTGLQNLVLLNFALPSQDEGEITLSQPRVMNLMNTLLSFVDEENEEVEMSLGLMVETTKALCNILPLAKSMYGEHWEKSLELIKMCWEGCVPPTEEHLAMIYMTLKLYGVLATLEGENEDLDEAWQAEKDELYDRLLNLFSKSDASENTHQPRDIVYTQIGRLLKKMNISAIPDPSAIYPLLATRSRPIQKAAFKILHSYIPTAQAAASLEIALESEASSSITLPAEILSMLITAPELPEDIDFLPECPTYIKSYTLPWLLVFDHFQNASFKLKSVYATALKEGSYLDPLLSFIAKILFRDNKAFDASKVSITAYTPDEMTPAMADLKWLATHLYYLCLTHTPSLAKSWWLDGSRNRATVLAIEAFTEKYMSPLLIDNELAAVAEWTKEHKEEEEEEGMKVKVAKAAREVTATYPVDDQAMEIMVKLPAIFPLRMVEVQGVKRVGLNEKKFAQMQLASQAVVNFQSGSIIDALTLFRKNVTLHFQGVSECAICYSILAVTPDRALPTKGCSTCKNKFHTTCLFKWFKTSNSSSCPLCRTSFSFY